MKAPFELERLGGAPSRIFDRRRPSRANLPWGTLDVARYPRELLRRAQYSWTQGAVSEYATALGLTRLSTALIAARAPVDLSAMVADFVVDELVHVEDNARLAMELGGAAPLLVSTETLGATSKASDPVERAAELAIRIACVGEAFSLPMLVSMAKAASHPLPRALLHKIAREEAPHAHAGGFVVQWALPALTSEARARLATAALDEIRLLTSYWKGLSPADEDTGLTKAGYPVELVSELGWLEAGTYAKLARRYALERVIEPIVRLGIPLDRAAALAVVNAA